MSVTTIPGLLGVFADRVYSSTDLNRHSGEVLNHARQGPVTISRNGEQFALLRREQAAGLIKAVVGSGRTLELVGGVLTAIEGGTMPPAMIWLKAFDRDELNQMTREILTATIRALNENGDWEGVEAVIHEWHESALVAVSGEIAEAINAPAQESPLTDPTTFLEGRREPGPAVQR